VPREFKFRKGDGRKAKRKDFGEFWVEERTIIQEVGDGEGAEDLPEARGIQEIARQVSEDLSSGKITAEEAKQRLAGAVQQLVSGGGEICLMCGGSKDPGAFVCDSCADGVEIETEIEFEGFDDD
jgi:hypothetical protein